MAVGEVISGIAQGVEAIGGIIASLFGSGQQDEAIKLLESTRDEFGRIPLPLLEVLRDQQIDATKLLGVHADPSVVNTQREVLSRLGKMSDGGLSLGDQIALQQGETELARQDSGIRARILNSMRERGLGGSGLELAAQLDGAQAGATRANTLGSNVIASAQQRALQALMNQGSMAGALRTQDVTEKTRAAEAQDAINKYNAAARERGAAFRNNVAQQHYDNQMGVLDRKAATNKSIANVKMDKAVSDTQAIGGAAQAVGYAGTAAGQFFNNQRSGGGGGYQSDYDNYYGGGDYLGINGGYT